MKSLPINTLKKNQNLNKFKTIYFSRKELFNILSAYSIKVSEGIWKDYALDNSKTFALFSIYRNTYETPILMIQKTYHNNKKLYEFTLKNQKGDLFKSIELSNVLKYLLRMPKLIKWFMENIVSINFSKIIINL